jgi:hypothetical protein
MRESKSIPGDIGVYEDQSNWIHNAFRRYDASHVYFRFNPRF